MTKDVAVFNLNPGVVRHEYVGSLINMLMWDIGHDQRIASYVPTMAGGCLGIFRNGAVEHFLKLAEEDEKLEWMLFLDSDIQLQPDTVDRLLEHASPEKPVIAGLYFMPLNEFGISPAIFDYKLDKEANLRRMTPVEKYEDNTLVECDGTGAGCLLMHKSVLLKLKQIYRQESWFAESVYGGVSFGEDFTFCLRVRQAGYPIYVHTGVKLGHVKNYILDERVWKDKDELAG